MNAFIKYVCNVREYACVYVCVCVCALCVCVCVCVCVCACVWVSFAKEPYKRDDFLQKRRVILRSLLIVATP